MVHFTQFDSCSLFYSAIQVIHSRVPDYSIRLSAGHRICAPYRSFSQLITTFFVLQLHRHPPWTYISLDHIIFSILFFFFRYSLAFFIYVKCGSLSLAYFTVCYLHFLHFCIFQYLPAKNLLFLSFTLTVKEQIKTEISNSVLWNRIDLNYRPPPYQSGALTNWATVPDI